jgi:acyl-CoA thioesterase I
MRISWKQRRTHGWGLVIFLALLLGSPSARGARNDSSGTKTILVFGDSLSDGFFLSRSEAYPALLIPKLKAAGLSYEVINASQSGGTSEEGIARLPPHLRQRIDIFILELGINDAFRGTPVDKIRDNLQSLIDTVRAKTPEMRVVIAGMQWPNHSGDDYVEAFGQMYVDLARKNHAALVPYLLEDVSGHPDLNLPDGLHPNAAGHRILAENVWRVLEPVAREVSGMEPARPRAGQ